MMSEPSTYSKDETVEHAKDVTVEPDRPRAARRFGWRRLLSAPRRISRLVQGAVGVVARAGRLLSRSPSASEKPEGACPACAAPALQRRRASGLVARARRACGRKRPYVCRSCGWRGWLPKGTRRIPAADWALDVEAPDFDAIEAAFETGKAATGRRSASQEACES